MTINELEDLAMVYNIRRFNKRNITESNENANYLDAFINFVRLCEIAKQTEIKSANTQIEDTAII